MYSKKQIKAGGSLAGGGYTKAAKNTHTMDMAALLTAEAVAQCE